MSHDDRPLVPSLPGPYDDVEEVQPNDDGRVAQLADDASTGPAEQARQLEQGGSLEQGERQPRTSPWPGLPHTGDQGVDEALETLAAMQHEPPADQVDAYVGVHRALQDRLADVEG